jgi:hypothetical protein
MRTSRLVPAALLLLAVRHAAAAQGIIIPDCRDCRTPWVPPAGRTGLPIESVQIDTKIEGQVATTHVDPGLPQRDRRHAGGDVLLPHPEGATVSDFAIWDGDRRLAGEVRPREEARRIYDGIVRRRRDPGLLEYAGEELFQASIFPINPRSTKKLELTYTQVLRAESGTVNYRYPLGVGRNASPVERLTGTSRSARSERCAPSTRPATPSTRAARRRPQGARDLRDGRGNERRDFQLFWAPSARGGAERCSPTASRARTATTCS